VIDQTALAIFYEGNTSRFCLGVIQYFRDVTLAIKAERYEVDSRSLREANNSNVAALLFGFLRLDLKRARSEAIAA